MYSMIAVTPLGGSTTRPRLPNLLNICCSSSVLVAAGKFFTRITVLLLAAAAWNVMEYIQQKMWMAQFWSSSYPLSPNLCPKTLVDCVGKPRIFIQCSCLIAPLCGYESALWRTRMFLSNAGRKIADWLLHVRSFIQCANLQALVTWSITATVH